MLFPKRKEYRNKKILKACHEMPGGCTIQIPGCQHSPTVPAHSNCSDDGKGGGQKADDIFVAQACNFCHDVLDGRVRIKTLDDNGFLTFPERIHYHDRGIKRTIRRLIDHGVIK